jgi:hypothetical protein
MKRSVKQTAVVLMLMVLVGITGFAQAKSLAVSANKTVVDGVVNAGEYSVTQEFGPLTLCANRTADTLNLAVVGSTSGWVAVGLGSLKMNGSTIFMGFVGTDGKAQFKPQTGQGHRHVDAKDVADSIVSYEIKEANGKTTLEIALKAADYIKSGQSTLDLIFAVGDDKSFTPYHSYRGSVSLKVS